MRSARTSSLVQHIQKVARKYALGSICAHLDDKSHRLHEVRGFFKPLTLTKIVEDLNERSGKLKISDFTKNIPTYDVKFAAPPV